MGKPQTNAGISVFHGTFLHTHRPRTSQPEWMCAKESKMGLEELNWVDRNSRVDRNGRVDRNDKADTGDRNCCILRTPVVSYRMHLSPKYTQKHSYTMRRGKNPSCKRITDLNSWNCCTWKLGSEEVLHSLAIQLNWLHCVFILRVAYFAVNAVTIPNDKSHIGIYFYFIFLFLFWIIQHMWMCIFMCVIRHKSSHINQQRRNQQPNMHGKQELKDADMPEAQWA